MASHRHDDISTLRLSPKVTTYTTRRRGNTRIEHLTGGGGISYPPNLADAKGNNGREGRICPHVEGGQRSGKPPTPRANTGRTKTAYNAELMNEGERR